ncbi:hypothetical protein ILUMI_22001 [Ignelater luminosus]|uniref:(3R)-3-hydroxyacyl-CoA dehydrogenase n=1 Tax=Ignelater luminosus TaxID=2038154 RepID=A0A8K0G372_IGNLU|nr:hypothetical protein ILUMI_22001 [Ignelater luminosus]
MSGSVLGKLTFVTGAGSGIGRAACQILAREGARIIAADRNINSANQVVEAISKKQPSSIKHLSLNIDVSQSESIKNALKQVLDVYKEPPTVIVNCAGITRDNFLLKLSEQDFQEVIDVNLKGTFLTTQIFAQAIVEKQLTNASIINIASIVGKYGNIGQANYSASKAGVELITRTAAKEFGQFGIRCNAVLPGFITTPMTDAVPDKVKAKFLAVIPCKRLGEPEEVAEVITFLASDKSSYINGASIEVTGGF